VSARVNEPRRLFIPAGPHTGGGVSFFFFFVSFLFVWFFGRVDVVIFDLGDGGRLN
jgi:hypothetical protein